MYSVYFLKGWAPYPPNTHGIWHSRLHLLHLPNPCPVTICGSSSHAHQSLMCVHGVSSLRPSHDKSEAGTAHFMINSHFCGADDVILEVSRQISCSFPGCATNGWSPIFSLIGWHLNLVVIHHDSPCMLIAGLFNWSHLEMALLFRISKLPGGAGSSFHARKSSYPLPDLCRLPLISSLTHPCPYLKYIASHSPCILHYAIIMLSLSGRVCVAWMQFLLAIFFFSFLFFHFFFSSISLPGFHVTL